MVYLETTNVISPAETVGTFISIVARSLLRILVAAEMKVQTLGELRIRDTSN